MGTRQRNRQTSLWVATADRAAECVLDEAGFDAFAQMRPPESAPGRYFRLLPEGLDSERAMPGVPPTAEHPYSRPAGAYHGRVLHHADLVRGHTVGPRRSIIQRGHAGDTVGRG